MSSILQNKRIFYSYWDVEGKGIDPQHLVTYSDSIIFDSYNRTLYSYRGVFGNHQMGSYHGEVFNDFDTNHAYGDYSSASGSNVTSYNAYEYGVGHNNLSKEGKTVFTVGNGTPEDPQNALEVHNDNATYINGPLYSEASYSYTTYISYQAEVADNVYVAGHDVRNAIEHMVRLLPVQTEGFYTGQYYIWLGTDIDLPQPEDRYKNVLYFVCDEVPEEGKGIYPPTE